MAQIYLVVPIEKNAGLGMGNGQNCENRSDSAMIQRARPEILAMGGYMSARSVEKSNRVHFSRRK